MNLAIFLAFVVVVLLLRCDALYWHRKSIKAPMNSETGQTLVFDKRTFAHPKLLYAICLAGDRHKNCTIRRFRHVYGKEQEKVYACNVTIEAKMRGSAIADKVRLVPLSEDRAILAYLERTNLDAYLGLMSVRLPDCKVHELPEVYRVDPDVIGDPPYEFELLALPSNGTAYHAIYRDSRKCGDEYCRLRVDPQNDYLVKPARWFDTGFDKQRQVVELVPFAAKFYRFLILEFGYGKSQFSLINEHNEVKVLDVQKRHKNESSYKTSWTLAYTTANERSGICHLLDSTLNCAQYDESGVQVYRTRHNFNQYDDVWVGAMHNLPGGNGILVLLVEHVPNRYRILRFNEFGKKVGYLDVTRFDCDWRENAIAGLFFEADNEYCVSLACYDTAEFSEGKRDRGNVDVVTERFSLDELETLSNDH